MTIHSPLLLGLGIGVFLIGLMLWRWASRHSIDLRGAALSTAMTAVRGGKIPTVPDELKAQFDKVAAEGTNVGRAKVIGGSVVKHFMAQVASIAGIVGVLAGAALIAVSLLWK